MRYTKILRTAYQITINNPVLWLLGLFLFGGFNFYLLSFFASLTGDSLSSFLIIINDAFALLPGNFIVTIIVVSILFVVFNAVKVLFIVYAHQYLHISKAKECLLCVVNEDRSFPVFSWLWKALAASLITIIVNFIFVLIIAALPAKFSAYGNIAMYTNIFLVTLAATVTGAWNMFTNYFVILHNLNFRNAAGSALDLLIEKFRNVLEFILILGIVYALCAMIGNVMINIWRTGYLGVETLYVKTIFAGLFVIWFALTNTFFAAAMLVFFDHLIKAVTSNKTAKNRQLPVNVLN